MIATLLALMLFPGVALADQAQTKPSIIKPAPIKPAAKPPGRQLVGEELKRTVVGRRLQRADYHPSGYIGDDFYINGVVKSGPHQIRSVGRYVVHHNQVCLEFKDQSYCIRLFKDKKGEVYAGISLDNYASSYRTHVLNLIDVHF